MITVGVAAYNSAGVVHHLLESLLAQQYPRDGMEIVVANNGSTDETCRVVQGYAGRGPIRLVHATHRRGPAVARNAVIEAALGEIIAFTDHDCVAHPGWLAEIEAGFADPSVGCVAGAILPGEPQTATERFYSRCKILTQELVLAHPFLPYAQTANAAFRKDVFRRVGGFDEILITCEDADLQWRMQLETDYRLCYRPEAVVWHRHRSSPRAMLRQAMGWGVGHALIYSKYRGRMDREPWSSLISDYRRILGLASLSLRRWARSRIGRETPEQVEDAFLSALFLGGIKLGRWRGSLAARVFYP